MVNLNAFFNATRFFLNVIKLSLINIKKQLNS
jgi:hypothetical protein